MDREIGTWLGGERFGKRKMVKNCEHDERVYRCENWKNHT